MQIPGYNKLRRIEIGQLLSKDRINSKLTLGGTAVGKDGIIYRVLVREIQGTDTMEIAYLNVDTEEILYTRMSEKARKNAKEIVLKRFVDQL